MVRTNDVRVFRDTSEGLRPILVDEDGDVITLDPQSCKARNGKLKCYLDNSHRALKSAHLHPFTLMGRWKSFERDSAQFESADKKVAATTRNNAEGKTV